MAGVAKSTTSISSFMPGYFTFNPDYALENLLRAETSSKQNDLPLFLLHHSGYYASVKKVSVLLSFQLSLRFLMHNLGLIIQLMNR